MSDIDGAHQDMGIDLGGFVRAIWRNRGRVLLVTALGAGAAFFSASLIHPQYRAETRLLIGAREPVSPDQMQVPARPKIDQTAIAGQMRLLHSNDLMKQVVRNMKLQEVREFDPGADPSFLSGLLVTFGLKKSPLDLPPEERVLKAFDEKLQVYQAAKSRVVGITFTAEDPQLAAAIPNEIARVYLSLQNGAKLDAGSEAGRLLEPEIANLREKVREAEAKVADYRASSGLLPSGDGSGFAAKQMDDLSAELARVRSERAVAEARAEGVRATMASGRDADTLNDVAGSQMIQRLKENEAAIQAEIADLSTTMLDGHPRLKALKSQLQGIRDQIRGETRKVLVGLDNEVEVARLRERQLVQQMNVLKAASAEAGEDEVGLRALEREAAAQRQLLETYLARYREAVSSAGSDRASPADASVISQAVEPKEAAFPKVWPITVIGGLASFLVGCVVIMLAELFSGRAFRPVGAALPEPATEEMAPADVAAVPESEDEAFDDCSIIAVVDHLLATDARVVVSLSPAGDQGSTDAVVLARLMAEEGRRVVLVDLTGSSCPSRLMAPSLVLPGITNLLAGEVAFADTIHADRLSDVHIVPAGDADPVVAMRGVERLPMVVESLSNAYDTVIVECGPATVSAVQRVARSIEASIVVSVHGASRGEVVPVIEGLAEAGFSDIVLMTSAEPGSDEPDRWAA